MIIKELSSSRFKFNNWVRDSRGYWNAISRMIVAGKFKTQVVLTVEEPDSEKVNAATQELCNVILENIEAVDNEGDDFRTEMLLESSGGGSIPFTLMFFDCPPDVQY